MTKAKVIPYTIMKQIIESCVNQRTQALLAFQYAMGNRAGELAKTYDHGKYKWDKEKLKAIKVGTFKSKGIQRDQFFETDDGLEWVSPNFKNAGKDTKRAWIRKENEPWLYNILKSWLQKRKESKYIFNLKERRIKQLIDNELKRYDPELHSHSLRHSRATHLADITGDPYLVQAVLGHARLETSAKYVNVAKERLKAKLGNRLFEDALGKKV